MTTVKAHNQEHYRRALNAESSNSEPIDPIQKKLAEDLVKFQKQSEKLSIVRHKSLIRRHAEKLV